MRTLATIVIFGLSFATYAESEIDIAREAMRDGLYEIAYSHAEKADGVIAEELKAASLAYRGEWRKVISLVDKALSTEMISDALVYYHALALAESGDRDAALTELANREFVDRGYAILARRLKVKIAMLDRGAENALKEMGTTTEKDSPEDLVLAASLMTECGDKEGASTIWKSVLALGMGTNAVFYAKAAVALDYVEAMKAAYEADVEPQARRIAGFGYARTLIRNVKTIELGDKIIHELVSANPDTDGAARHFVALACAYVEFGDYERASTIIKEALESWPELIEDYAALNAKAWSEYGLNKYRDAIASFRMAEAKSRDKEIAATCAAKIGDILLDLDQVEAADTEYQRVTTEYEGTTIAKRVAEMLDQTRLEREARKLYAEYRFDEAKKAFEELAIKFPSSATRMMMLVVYCMYGSGDDAGAKAKATELLSTTDNITTRSSALIFLAKLACNDGNWQEAVKLFDEYLSLSHDDDETKDVSIWAANASYMAGDFKAAITKVSDFAAKFPNDHRLADAFVIQGEALMELARFDEAVLVLKKSLKFTTDAAQIVRIKTMLGDALYAMGPDDSRRFNEALEIYRDTLSDESESSSRRIVLEYKAARTLDRMRRQDEAIDEYYSGVVLAFRNQRKAGNWLDDDAQTAFVRSAFRLAEIFEERGQNQQAAKILELVVTGGVSASKEASKRLERLKKKGALL